MFGHVCRHVWLIGSSSLNTPLEFLMRVFWSLIPFLCKAECFCMVILCLTNAVRETFIYLTMVQWNPLSTSWYSFLELAVQPSLWFINKLLKYIGWKHGNKGTSLFLLLWNFHTFTKEIVLFILLRNNASSSYPVQHRMYVNNTTI